MVYIGTGKSHGNGGQMSLIKKLPTICNRHSSKTINELITIYKQVEESTDENSYFSFGINLKEALKQKAICHSSEAPEIVLFQYKVHAKSYIDNNLISFNISVVTLLFTILGMVTKVISFSKLGALLLLIYAVLASVWLIYQHCKSQKLREILLILEN